MATEIQHYDQNDPSTVLSLSQKAESMLSKSSLKPKSKALAVVSAIEEPTEWAELEQIFLACLRSRDDEKAHLCLERLANRFGAENHRIMALRGLYQEAESENEEDLRRVLQSYNKIVKDDPMNVPIHKRRNALIRSLGKTSDALECLVQFLGSFPSDAEAWCELSDLYQTQGMYSQAIYCLEEALLIVPNSWNLHARLGEMNYIASQSGQEAVAANEKYLAEALRRFARSVELCEDYLRGYYGLKLTAQKLLVSSSSKDSDTISPEIVQQHDELATTKLNYIIKHRLASAVQSQQAQVIAAQALLDQSKT